MKINKRKIYFQIFNKRKFFFKRTIYWKNYKRIFKLCTFSFIFIYFITKVNNKKNKF